MLAVVPGHASDSLRVLRETRPCNLFGLCRLAQTFPEQNLDRADSRALDHADGLGRHGEERRSAEQASRCEASRAREARRLRPHLADARPADLDLRGVGRLTPSASSCRS